MKRWQSKNNNREIMIGVATDEIIEELCNSLLHRYQVALQEMMKDTNFAFDYVEGLFYKCH